VDYGLDFPFIPYSKKIKHTTSLSINIHKNNKQWSVWCQWIV
jgi:hypothetical protein